MPIFTEIPPVVLESIRYKQTDTQTDRQILPFYNSRDDNLCPTGNESSKLIAEKIIFNVNKSSLRNLTQKKIYFKGSKEYV